MSKKNPNKDSKLDAARQGTEMREAPKEHGLSISTIDKGFNMVPDAFQTCEEIFDLLFERFEDAMMKKRVETEYKNYAVLNNV